MDISLRIPLILLGNLMAIWGLWRAGLPLWRGYLLVTLYGVSLSALVQMEVF